MTTLVLGERPPELEALLQRRRALGLDRRDEVWDGVYVMAPYAHSNHGLVKADIVVLLAAAARAAGLRNGDSFNLGEPDDYRVPDAGWHRTAPGSLYVPTAALVLEVLSPDDHSFAKLPFYAAHGVDEVLLADPDARKVRGFALVDGSYVERGRSALLDLDLAALAAEVDWPVDNP